MDIAIYDFALLVRHFKYVWYGIKIPDNEEELVTAVLINMTRQAVRNKGTVTVTKGGSFNISIPRESMECFLYDKTDRYVFAYIFGLFADETERLTVSFTYEVFMSLIALE